MRSQLARARLLINACIRFVKVCSGGKADRDEASPCSNLRMTQPEPRSRSQRPRGRRRKRPRRTKQLRIKRHDRWAESGVVVGLENLEPWTHEGSRAESKMFNAAKSSTQSGNHILRHHRINPIRTGYNGYLAHVSRPFRTSCLKIYH